MVELENGHKKILTKNAKERNAVARQLLSSSVAKESFRGKLTQGKKVNTLCFRYLIKTRCMTFGNNNYLCVLRSRDIYSYLLPLKVFFENSLLKTF